MPYNNGWPYTDVHQLNLDWIVDTVKNVKDKTDEIDQAVADSQGYAEAAQQSAENASQSAEDAHDDLISVNSAIADWNEDVTNLKNQVNTNTQNIAVDSARIDAIISGTTPDANAELIDIRVGADGTTYPTAGDAVRGQITDLKSDLDDVTHYKWENYSGLFQTGRIETNVAIGATVTTTRVTDTSFDSAICACEEGDVFSITGTGGNSGRLYAFTDSEYKLISKSDAYITVTEQKIKAPADGYLICNAGVDLHVLKKGTLEIKIPERYDIDGMRDNFDYVWDDITDGFQSGMIRTNVNVGTVVNITPEPNTSFDYIIVQCQKGDSFKISGTGGNANRLYAFCDEAYVLISKSNGYITVTDLEVTAPSDGYAIFNAGKDDHVLYEHKLQIVIPSSVLKLGSIWSSNIIPDHGITSEYSAISAYNPTLSELYSLYDALVTAHPNYITKTDLGLDQSGTYHLYKYSFIPESIAVSGVGAFSLPNMPKILLGSGIHGNGSDAGDKPEMVVGVYYLMKNICDNYYGNEALTYLRHHVQIELIPVQNPWGYVNQSRRNSRGVDINRNFSYGWTLGTEGTNTYGGTAPFSEAESVIIRDFIEANTDGLFYLDLHTTGGTPTQDKMIYYDMSPNDNLIIPANDTVIYLSDKWNHENISNLDTTIMHGYVDASAVTGSGKIFEWVNAVKGIPSCTMEAFPNFTNSGIADNSELVMRMCQEELVTFILKSIRYFKFNYLNNQRS